MTSTADNQASLEATLKGEIVRMYQEVADHPDDAIIASRHVGHRARCSASI